MNKKKCPICGTEMIIDTSAVCTSIPPKFRCVCPSCNCLDFIKTSEYDQYKEEPSLPSGLDEAAEAHRRKVYCGDSEMCQFVREVFKAGAQWRDAQIPKLPDSIDEAAEEYGYINWQSEDYHEGASEGLPFDAIGHTANCFKAGAEWLAGKFQKIEGDLVDWYSTSDGKDYCCGVKTDEAFEIPEGFYIRKKQ